MARVSKNRGKPALSVKKAGVSAKATGAAAKPGPATNARRSAKKADGAAKKSDGKAAKSRPTSEIAETAVEKQPVAPKATGRRPRIPPVVGVGASAGGLKAFQAFVSHIPRKSGIAWVLVQHMAPDRESLLPDILSRETSLDVVQVVKETRVKPDCIYVAAPGRTMTIRNGTLHPVSDRDPRSRRTSIDAFFLSLAEDLGDRTGCALLSGAGTDGTLGLKAIKEVGGLTLTQTLGAAEYDSMLLSAVRTGLVDRELEVEEMADAFVDFLTQRLETGWDGPIADSDRRLIFDRLRGSTGHDFGSYKSSTVDRRIRRRMQMLGITEMKAYLQRLDKDKAEATLLFRDMLIGVTQFFRDHDTFDAIAKTVLPKLLEGKTADDEIRVWVPGCATGEEAYSLAILLLESVSKLDSVPDIKVFGTDIDDNALHAARVGRYPKGIAADISPERLQRYFEAEDGTYTVRSQLREVCLFAQHNMLRDPPFSRIDMISCRNVMIYMNADLQRRLIPMFHYAVRRGGFLVLGPAESAASYAKLFHEVDRKHRIYQRVGDTRRLPAFPIVEASTPRSTRRPIGEPIAQEIEMSDIAAKRVLAEHAPPFVVIDEEFEIIETSAGTGAYLELAAGRPRFNLRSMARSGLAIDIRAAVTKVMATGRAEVRKGLSVHAGGQTKHIVIAVEPLAEQRAGRRLYLVVFKEVTLPQDDSAPESSRRHDDEVTRAIELELQHTKERLQSTLEELETSNEELKASNEELSSVNEELQSSNEELETSKEELQSINEELRTVNSELSTRVDELDRVNNDLKNLFANTEIAMLFLDDEFRIMNFTPPAKPLFHLRDHDIGRPLDELSGRLTFSGLKGEVKAVVADGTPREREVESNGDSAARTFILRVLPYRDQQEKIRGAVLTLIDITERKAHETQLAAMVGELNHRVKNSLASVQAMLRQTRSGARTIEDFVALAEGRLQAMVLAHNLLSETHWERANIRGIAEGVLAPFAEPGSKRLRIHGPNLELRPNAVVSLGLILHELGTNAGKYGAWSVNGGSVNLGWVYQQGDSGTTIITWTEQDGPGVSKPERDGFGLRFIRESTRHDLRGSSEMQFTAKGFICRLELPGEAIAWKAPNNI